ncbi:unnamed protein product [Meganyctiphanes norvegica]|uniref:Uncharacterized protein n=1 Tax=Meganyctiphanes norvegica TaxID=48144 RepID=A0AAV2RLB2_MEGNR
MCDILHICTLFILTFGLVYGVNECKNQEEGLGYIGCPVYKIESQQECYWATNDGDGNLVFYLKPLTTGQLAISLHERHQSQSSSQRTDNLFTIPLSDSNVWRKIKIRRGEVRHFLSAKASYFLEVNNQDHVPVRSSEIEIGNEIRVKTVKSLWTSECDPRDYTPPQTTKATQHTPEPTTPTQAPTQSPTQAPTQPPSASLQPQQAAFTITGDTKIVIIAAVSLALILMAILMIVILVLRHRRRNRDQALTQTTDQQFRLSRHVSENSLYASYDNEDTGENQVPQDTNTSNGVNQRRGSAHDSENSLYGGIN